MQEKVIEPSALRIELPGDFSLRGHGRPVRTMNTPRRQALLAYLALHRHAPQQRQRVAFLFWPDSTDAQALTNLRRELHHLRHALPRAAKCLHVDSRTVRLRPEAPCSRPSATLCTRECR